MISIIGLPDQAIKEADERIQASIESCGYDIPKDKVILSLAPGNRKKRGSHFDLGMIIALLFQTDQISPKSLADYAFMNPCPCGYHPSPRCRCTDYEIIRYRSKISGPILERIDIQKNVRRVDYFDLSSEGKLVTSQELRERVENARAIQTHRFRQDGISCNAQMTTSMIQKYCKLDEECTKILKHASEEFGYSARVIHKLLRMARTAADLEASDMIRKEDIVKVLGCRDLDVSSSKLYTVKIHPYDR